MVLRLIRDLPGDRAFLPPSLVDHPTNLAPASGRQDHTISPSARNAARRANQLRPAMCVHRIPLPTSVTIASRPSLWVRDTRMIVLIWGRSKAEYFSRADWTSQIALNPVTKLAFARTSFSGRSDAFVI